MYPRIYIINQVEYKNISLEDAKKIALTEKQDTIFIKDKHHGWQLNSTTGKWRIMQLNWPNWPSSPKAILAGNLKLTGNPLELLIGNPEL